MAQPNGRDGQVRAHLIELIRTLEHSDLMAAQDCIVETLAGTNIPGEIGEGMDSDLKQVLTADLRQAAREMSDTEARYNVDIYYQVQELRKRAREQIRSMEGENAEPHRMLALIYQSATKLERRIYTAMDEYSSGRAVGIWSKLNRGIGPVLAAGLMAHIDIERARGTVGPIWRFAGLDPTVEWKGTKKAEALVREICGTLAATREVTDEEFAQVCNGVNRKQENIRQLAADEDTGRITPKSLAAAAARRPYNAKLRVLCWKIGESFKNFSNRDECFYGHIYAGRRDLERRNNENLLYREQAELKLATVDIGRSTEAYKSYIQGKLPPSRIILRAQRYAVKIFLSHWHFIEYLDHYGVEPPLPYVLTLPGHDTPIEKPHWPLVDALAA